jgi:hypothetical protein
VTDSHLDDQLPLLPGLTASQCSFIIRSRLRSKGLDLNLLGSCRFNDTVDEDSWEVDLHGLEFADGDDMFGLLQANRQSRAFVNVASVRRQRTSTMVILADLAIAPLKLCAAYLIQTSSNELQIVICHLLHINCRSPEDHIPRLIGLPSSNKCYITLDCLFHDIMSTIELSSLPLLRVFNRLS